MSNFDAIFVSKYDVTECFLLPLCVRSSTTFPLDGLYPLNWTDFPPKSTHQQKLLRDCYQNNATAQKEALNDVIQETNMASKFKRFSNFNWRYLLN